MVEFKAVINDVSAGTSYQVNVKGHHANSLIGKRIGEVVDGIFVGLPGYKLKITGGSDKDGFPMRKDLPGSKRRKVLLSSGVGFHPRQGGQRQRKTLRGNTISPDTSQLNMMVTQLGSKTIEELFSNEASE
jgi:small subunit ribosomal protein S6e